MRTDTYLCVKGSRYDDEDEPWTPLELRLLAKLRDLLAMPGPVPAELVRRVVAATATSPPRPHLRLIPSAQVTVRWSLREELCLRAARPMNDA